MRWLAISRKEWLALALLLVVGLGVRVYGIERYGLWIDELATAQCVNYDLSSVLECRRYNLGAPIFKVATNLAYTFAGRPPLPVSETLVRLPEVLAGTLAIFAAWLAAREWLNKRGAWLNALLWVFAPVAVAYSQEARAYAWLLLSANLSAWMLALCLRSKTRRTVVAYGFLTALNFYSHYLGLFVIAGQFFFAALYVLKTYRHSASDARAMGLRVVSAGTIAAGVMALYLPYALDSFAFLQTARAFHIRIPPDLTYWSNVQTWLLLDRIELPFVALSLFILLCAGAWWLWRTRRMTLGLVLCWLLPVFGFVLIRQTGFSAMRYWTVILTPVFWLTTASALAIIAALEKIIARANWRMPRQAATVLTASVGIVLLLPFLAQFYADQFESWRFDDWRGAAQFFRAQRGQNDLLLSLGDAAMYHTMAFDFYFRDAHIMQPKELDSAWMTRAAQTNARAWAITYARDEAQQEFLRAQLTPDFDVWWFKNLALISPKPAPQENLRASTTRLLTQLRAVDEAQLRPALALLSEQASGENLIQNAQLETAPDGAPRAWKMDAAHGAIVADADVRALKLTRGKNDAQVTASQTITLLPERAYMFRFECARELASGSARTYIRFQNARGKAMSFPRMGGFICPSGEGWQQAAFTFRAPRATQAAPTAQLILRNAGIGDALWRNFVLTEIPE